MSEKLDLNFLRKMNKSVEPQIVPGETGLEAIQRAELEKKQASETLMDTLSRMEKERVEKLTTRNATNPPSNQPTPPPVKEVVFYEGYKLSRDFFTAIAVCLLKSKDPEVKSILATFGFELKDLNGKEVVFEKKKKTRRK